MSWRESLRVAKFKEVPFFVQSHEAEVGRRVQVHEYPMRDRPFTEDLGRSARYFSIDAYVLGADYMLQRDALLEAFELPGSGTLIHPYLGERLCTLIRCRLRESTAEGGMARFSLEFVETGDATYPDASFSTQASVSAASDELANLIIKGFPLRHYLNKKPEFVALASQVIFKAALDQIQGAISKVRAESSIAATLTRNLKAQQHDLISLLFDPANAAQAMGANIRMLVRSLPTTPGDALSLARLFYRFGSLLPKPITTTPSRRLVASNQVELLRLVRMTAVAEGARAASVVAFAGYPDAIAARDDILDVIDTALADAPDDIFDSLRTLRAAVVRDAAARGADLARVVTYTPRTTTPALVLAQRLYADSRREGELITRNRVRHPLFVPGGQSLEVLTDST